MSRSIRHPGLPCGRRRRCWRPSCRKQWRDYQTVELLPNKVIVAHCHGLTYTSRSDFDTIVERWRYGGSTVIAA